MNVTLTCAFTAERARRLAVKGNSWIALPRLCVGFVCQIRSILKRFKRRGNAFISGLLIIDFITPLSFSFHVFDIRYVFPGPTIGIIDRRLMMCFKDAYLSKSGS